LRLRAMSLILQEGADVEAFKRVVLSRKGKIARCRLGPEILDLSLEGKDSVEIAEVLKAKGRGGLQPVSPSTISRWLRATNLFRGRARPGAEKRDAAVRVKKLLEVYEGEILGELEGIGRKFLTEIPRAIRRARKKPFCDVPNEYGRSDRRKRRNPKG